jgi:hypothetical protein
MGELTRSVLVEGAALLLLGGAEWFLRRMKRNLLSRNPKYAWVPLMVVGALAVLAEGGLAYLTSVKLVSFPFTLVLFATPPLLMGAAVFLELRALWAAGIRGADASVKTGIDYKTALDLCHNHIDFLGTGAAKLTGEDTFEAVLARCRDDQVLRFLLTKPDTDTLADAAKRYGRDRDEYARLVLGSLRKLADIKSRRALGHLEVRFYDRPPPFRLMFIDHSLCLVSPNVYGRGDGSQLPQLHVANSATSGESIYRAFEMYFDDLWGRSVAWDFQEFL